MAVPYTFATATSSLPLSQLDSNFATPITFGSQAVYLGSTVSSLSNISLSNVAIVNLTTPLPVASGGTGSTALTANSVVVGNGTSNVLLVAPGTSGNVLTSNGTTWISQAFAAATNYVKAWCLFDGTSAGPITPTAGFNISSITKNATGDYTVNFTSALADANYAVNITTSPKAGVSFAGPPQYAYNFAGGVAVPPTASAFRFVTINASLAATDFSYVMISVFR